MDDDRPCFFYTPPSNTQLVHVFETFTAVTAHVLFPILYLRKLPPGEPSPQPGGIMNMFPSLKPRGSFSLASSRFSRNLLAALLASSIGNRLGQSLILNQTLRQGHIFYIFSPPHPPRNILLKMWGKKRRKKILQINSDPGKWSGSGLYLDQQHWNLVIYEKIWYNVLQFIRKRVEK